MPQKKKSAKVRQAAHSMNAVGSQTTWVLVFSVVFALFIIGPALLGLTFTPYPLMKVSDIVDLFTPLVLLPLYWILFRTDENKNSDLKEELAFMLFAGFWILGQGMHLSANSIGQLTENLAGTDVNALTNFYDETLSHYLWHFGVIGLSATLMFHQWRNPLIQGRNINWDKIVGGLIYGFTFFAMVIEGVTIPIGLPFSVAVVVFGLLWSRKKLKQMPLLGLFLIGYAFALGLFIIWRLWQGSFIEFTKSPDFQWLFHKSTGS